MVVMFTVAGFVMLDGGGRGGLGGGGLGLGGAGDGGRGGKGGGESADTLLPIMLTFPEQDVRPKHCSTIVKVEGTPYVTGTVYANCDK